MPKCVPQKPERMNNLWEAYETRGSMRCNPSAQKLSAGIDDV